MLLNKLLVANLMVGLTIIFQGLIPIGYLSAHGSFWMYIAGIIFVVLAVIAFAGLVFMGRSACVMTMGQMKLGIYHSPAAGFSLLSLVFFIVYAYVAEVSYNNAAIQNMALLLTLGTGFLLLTSLIIVLLAFRTNYEISPPGGDDDE